MFKKISIIALSSLTFISQAFSIETEIDQEGFVAIKPIAVTRNDPAHNDIYTRNNPIYTGLFYTMSPKISPYNYTSVRDEISPSGRYMEAAFHENTPNQAQWYWASSERAREGLYTVHSRAFPESYVAYTDRGSTDGRFMQLATEDQGRLHKFRRLGAWRNEALWRLNSTEVSDFYRMSSDSMPNYYTALDMDREANASYMQIASFRNQDNPFRSGAERQDEALWSLKPTGYRVIGKLEDIRAKNSHEEMGAILGNRDRWKMSSIDSLNLIDTIIRNPSSAIIHQSLTLTSEEASTYTYRFEHSNILNSLRSTRTQFGASASFLNLFRIGGGSEHLAEDRTITSTHQFFDRTFSERSALQITNTIYVQPGSNIKACAKIERSTINLPFTATLRLSAEADRIRPNGIVVRNRLLQNINIVRHLLRHEGYPVNRLTSSTNGTFITQIQGELTINKALQIDLKLEEEIIQ